MNTKIPQSDHIRDVTPPINAAVATAQAARGDDDVMSQPARSALKLYVGSQIWLRHIDRAKKTWSKLSEDDLTKIGGDAAKLVALLNQHYAYSNADIDSQVSNFFKNAGG